MTPSKTILILGANSDVAKEATLLYLRKGYHVIAASRSTAGISSFMEARPARGLPLCRAINGR